MKNIDNTKKFYITNSFFFEQLINNYNPKKLYKFFFKKNQFITDTIQYTYHYYIPIVLNNHWSLVKVNIKKKKISFYDSLNNTNRNIFIFKTLKPFFDDLLKSNEDWRLSVVNVPQQNNMFDCGIYMLQYLDILISKKYCNIEADSIPYYRIKIGIELIKGEKVLSS